jgi:chromosome segregation ATPase
MTRIFVFTVLMFAGLSVSSSAYAEQSEADRLRDALRSATMQTRALEDQRVALQARLTEAERQAASLRAQLDAAKAQAVQADKDYRQAVQDFNARLDERNQTLDKWKDAYTEAATVARTKDAERAKFEMDFKTYKARTTTCEAKNTRLVKLESGIVAAYRDLDGMKLLGVTEPVTGIGNVDRQNRVQDFIDQIQEQKVQP